MRKGLSNLQEGDDRQMRLTQENAALHVIVDDLRLRIRELEHLANTDTLVPLPNRRAFLREIDRAIQDAGKGGAESALAYLDLDGLKRVNDTHGHHVGDALLTHVALRLKENQRAADRVARIAGDEFGLLLDQLDAQSAKDRLKAVVMDISLQPLDLGHMTIKVSVTAGLTMIRAEDSVAAVIARADAAMYRARDQRSER
jgi:diguanylate cyclase (GGDEF)-like protein